MTQKYKALEEKLAEELNQGWQKLDLREVAKKLNRECTGEDYWWYGYGDHSTPDTLMKEICDELVGDPSKTGSHVDGSVCGVVDRKRDIELLYLRVNEYDRLPDGSSHRKKRDPDEATLIYDVIEDKFLVEPILEAAARKEAEYETEHSRFERVARYLNRNLREFKDWDDEKNRFAIRSMLYGVLGDVGGEDVRTADSGDHMYIDRNNHTHTLLYDAGRNEFMVGNA